MKKFVLAGVLVLAALAAGACNKSPGTAAGDPPGPAGSSSAPMPGGSPADSGQPDPGGSGLPGLPGNPDNPGTPADPATGAFNVVLKLGGAGKALAVHYGVNGTETNLRSASLPWGQQIKADSGDTVTLGGSGAGGDLTCEILVNGAQTVTNTGDMPSCSYTIP